MFISKKKLERILQEERSKVREEVWQQIEREREQDRIYQRLDRLEGRVCDLKIQLNEKNTKSDLTRSDLWKKIKYYCHYVTAI